MFQASTSRTMAPHMGRASTPLPAIASRSQAMPRRPAVMPPSRTPLQRKCAACDKEESGLQARLEISAPGDALEQEADRVADRVTAMSAPGAAPAIQRRAGGAGLPEAAPPLVQQAVQAPGRPLDGATRAFMEPRFGRDLGAVRVHTDTQAAQSAHAVNALAYTVGRDIVFGAGRYAPSTAEGRNLLAHELTHTIQQTGNAAPPLQRLMGDGHDLTAPRFAGDLVLEAVYDNERLLKEGDTGAAVRTLQQALLDSAMELPKFGVDGKFGPETKAAVSEFQRASGLVGTDLDGIVGPITMGWLDQRFSAGPTPAGAQPHATPGCTAIKTVNVDMVSLDGSTQNAGAQFDRANTILNQCCVRLNLSGGGSFGAIRSRELLGGDTDLQQSPSCNSATAEELSLFSGATSDLNLSGRVRVFFVATINSGAPSYSVPPFCAGGPAAAINGMAVVANSGTNRALAHEFSHILLNSGTHPADPLNLMSPVAAPPGEQLTAAQCATIFANA
jgi:peptidoglycan hydrolase-like protein with peptidoglycan-binding domain